MSAALPVSITSWSIVGPALTKTRTGVVPAIVTAWAVTYIAEPLTVQVTLAWLIEPDIGPKVEVPLIVTLAEPGCWLPQSSVPAIWLNAPSLPTAEPGGVDSVRAESSVAPVAA